VVVVGATVSRGPEAVVGGAWLEGVAATVADVEVDDELDELDDEVDDTVVVEVSRAAVGVVEPCVLRVPAARSAAARTAALHHLRVLLTGPA
jgi:hypothetical protein